MHEFIADSAQHEYRSILGMYLRFAVRVVEHSNRLTSAAGAILRRQHRLPKRPQEGDFSLAAMYERGDLAHLCVRPVPTVRPAPRWIGRAPLPASPGIARPLQPFAGNF
jgi:hypothetical protein